MVKVSSNPCRYEAAKWIESYESYTVRVKSYIIRHPKKPGHVKITWNNVKSCDTKREAADAPMDIPHISTH